MPAHRRLQRHARIHQRQRGAADRGHRGRAVRLGDLRDDADGVGELVRRAAAADGARARRACRGRSRGGRAAHAAGFADREGREVVVQHEGALVVALERVDVLLVLAGAERGDDQRLGLAAGEQGRAVGAGQHADLGHDRADGLGVAAVDAEAGVEDAVAHHVLLEMLEGLGELLRRAGRLLAFADQLGHDLVLGLGDGFMAVFLGGEWHSRRGPRLRRWTSPGCRGLRHRAG